MAHLGDVTAGARGDRLTVAARGLAMLGGLLMLVVAVIVTFSTVMRWIIDESVPGDIEIVQIATAFAVFSFLPYCQARHGNVLVDTFTLRLSARTQRRIDAFWDVVYSLSAAVLAWRLLIGAYDTISSQTVSMMLGLPIGYVIAACAAMAAFLAVVTAVGAVRLCRARP
jgi:TRAP-type C4-dicarboxylate transport system permease small subunit